MARDDRSPASSARGGPQPTDAAYEQNERERNELRRQPDAQATAEAEDEHRAVAERTGNAGRAGAAASGREPPMDVRSDADRAYQESRGDQRDRDNRPG
jgi:hypothetical protein